MKKIINCNSIIKALSFFCAILIISSCEDNLLDTNVEPINRNEILASALTEADLPQLAQGVYSATLDTEFSNYFWFIYGYHETMGDALTMPWGNFGGRWVNQTEQIFLDGGELTATGQEAVANGIDVTIDNGILVTPPEGGAQSGEIAVRNDRAQGNGNATVHEWTDMYQINGQTNLIISTLPNLELSQIQIQAYTAWALWWKAFAYHRIGSMYEEGLIIDDVSPLDGTNSNFLDQSEIIARSNSVLDELSTLLSQVSDTGSFDDLLESFQLNIVTNATVDYSGLIANLNTLRARNLVYNTTVANMTSADWANVVTWTSAGIMDNNIAFGAESEPTLLNNQWLPGAVTGFWYFPSPRLIQDINEDDARLAAYFEADFDFPNQRNRGIQYGATHFWNSETPIVSATPNQVIMYYAGTHEENILLRAEALIRTGNIEDGLQDLDAVRNLQSAQLPATVGTNLTEAEALEEVRKERRLALLMRGVNFYDARRYGVSNSTRDGVWVLDTTGNILYTDSTITYGYLDYWPVPVNETDFNNPPGGLN